MREHINRSVRSVPWRISMHWKKREWQGQRHDKNTWISLFYPIFEMFFRIGLYANHFFLIRRLLAYIHTTFCCCCCCCCSYFALQCTDRHSQVEYSCSTLFPSLHRSMSLSGLRSRCDSGESILISSVRLTRQIKSPFMHFLCCAVCVCVRVCV